MRIAPIKRSLDLALLFALIGTVVWTFQIKQESEEALKRVAKLEKQIAAEKIQIDLLKSDWSLLTNPARLQTLVERHQNELDLLSVEASQIATMDDLPPISLPNVSVEESREGFAEIDQESLTGSLKTPGTGKEAGDR